MTKKSTPPLIKHEKHQVEIRLASPGSKHHGSFHCLDCNKWIAWASREQINLAIELGLIKN